jgi:rhodanese-related sulfurtransferase
VVHVTGRGDDVHGGDGTVAAVSSRIDALVAAAREGISRIDAGAADAKRRAGAMFIDTRPVEQRDSFGSIPGAVAIDRNVLEWRVDPTSDHRHPDVAAHDGPIVVFCQQGYSSSLAVKTLVDLGVRDVHDLAGGFEAWAASGFPVSPPAAGA